MFQSRRRLKKCQRHVRTHSPAYGHSQINKKGWNWSHMTMNCRSSQFLHQIAAECKRRYQEGGGRREEWREREREWEGELEMCVLVRKTVQRPFISMFQQQTVCLGNRPGDDAFAGWAGGADHHVCAHGLCPLHAHWDAQWEMPRVQRYGCRHTQVHFLAFEAVDLLCAPPWLLWWCEWLDV